MNLYKVPALPNAEYSFQLRGVIWALMHRWGTRRNCLQSRAMTSVHREAPIRMPATAVHKQSKREAEHVKGKQRRCPARRLTRNWRVPRPFHDVTGSAAPDFSFPQGDASVTTVEEVPNKTPSAQRLSSVNHLKCFNLFSFHVRNWKPFWQ